MSQVTSSETLVRHVQYLHFMYFFKIVRVRQMVVGNLKKKATI